MYHIPTFRHPHASRIFPVVRAALIVAGGLSTESATDVAHDRRSYGRQLVRTAPGSTGQAELRWGFAADMTGGEDLDHGHVFVCLHLGPDHVAVLCRCSEDRDNGQWRLETELSVPSCYLARALDLRQRDLSQAQALDVIRRIGLVFGRLPVKAETI